MACEFPPNHIGPLTGQHGRYQYNALRAREYLPQEVPIWITIPAAEAPAANLATEASAAETSSQSSLFPTARSTRNVRFAGVMPSGLGTPGASRL